MFDESHQVVRALSLQHLCAHRQAAGLSTVQLMDFHVSQVSEGAVWTASDPTSRNHFSTTDSRADAFRLAISKWRL
jgi:hypothetical protein